MNGFCDECEGKVEAGEFLLIDQSFWPYQFIHFQNRLYWDKGKVYLNLKWYYDELFVHFRFVTTNNVL